MRSKLFAVLAVVAGVGMACQQAKRNPGPAVRSQGPGKQVVELRHVVVPAKASARPATPVGSVASVGQQAPDFEAPAYYKGKFTKVKLSDYRGKWVLLCFYPGDFTFV